MMWINWRSFGGFFELTQAAQVCAFAAVASHLEGWLMTKKALLLVGPTQILVMVMDPFVLLLPGSDSLLCSSTNSGDPGYHMCILL